MDNPIKNITTDFEHIILLITEARNRVYTKANAELVMLYFNVGQIVSEKVANGNWGDGTVNDLADYIIKRQPLLKGFNRRGLYRMKQFYEVYSDDEIVSSVVTQLDCIDNQNDVKVSPPVTQLGNNSFEFCKRILSKINWAHHLLILSKTKGIEEKFYYLNLCLAERLSKRELERQLNSATFERTMLGNKFDSVITRQLPEGIFKDPYVFEFLALPEIHSENDLQQALIKNLQNFILEMGKGFTYMGSEYRLQVGNKDYYTDLLFYHRDLQCMVLFELKIEEFQPEFLGKLNFYLEALDRDVKRPFENPSIGVLLCKGKDVEVVEYALARNLSPALIADYETKLIDKKLLAEKLNQLSEIFYRNEE
ncbi:PDDEXK nuclease domain-containing protein [Pedobacter sp. UBA5917]|jgi:predicted nuclease of restriction endonuclease-like (RecB) superfamily|uniref:PDDEXK nuclease domain-containing protein n=1 Tax=Pedobacter sp. UBA5917 TaxID=1947061 RepID=UPI0025CCFB1E|nr:PDDEXK nuclease domain-containing protein [Pedobacter sp. UBA5917]